MTLKFHSVLEVVELSCSCKMSSSWVNGSLIIVSTDFYAVSCNGKESKNPVLWPWPWPSTMTLTFSGFRAVVKIHVRAKFHRAKCSGSWVTMVTEKERNSDDNNTVIATADCKSPKHCRTKCDYSDAVVRGATTKIRTTFASSSLVCNFLYFYYEKYRNNCRTLFRKVVLKQRTVKQTVQNLIFIIVVTCRIKHLQKSYKKFLAFHFAWSHV